MRRMREIPETFETEPENYLDVQRGGLRLLFPAG